MCCPLITFDPVTWSIPNLVHGLRLTSRWSLLIFRSHVQRSRLNHSFEPSVLSTLYILIPRLLASNSLCFYREDKPEFCTMGEIYDSETFLVFRFCNAFSYYSFLWIFLKLQYLAHFCIDLFKYLGHWQLYKCLLIIAEYLRNQRPITAPEAYLYRNSEYSKELLNNFRNVHHRTFLLISCRRDMPLNWEFKDYLLSY